jgi:hypothetical protein
METADTDNLEILPIKQEVWLDNPEIVPPEPFQEIKPMMLVKLPKESRPRLSKNGKSLTFHILPEIASMLSIEASVFKNDRSLEFQGRPVTQDSIVNSLLASYFTKNSTPRKKLVRTGLLVVESRMAVSQNDAT